MKLILITIAVLIVGILLTIIGIFRKNKKIKYLGIYLVILLIVLFMGFVFYSGYSEMQELKSKMGGTLTENELLPVPDRIIYKNNDNEYFIITPNDNIFDTVFTEISNRVDMTKNGEKLTNEKINEIKENEKFIELDYNTKSKNRIFPLEQDYIGMINMLEDGGQITKIGLIDRDKLIKKVEQCVKWARKYEYEKGKIYLSTREWEQLPSDIELEEKQYGIYRLVINNQEEFANIHNKLEISIADQEIPSIDFSRNNVIVTASYYEIADIEENIGNIKYHLKTINEKYKISVFIVSKIINTNCIYYNIEPSENNNSQNINSTYITKSGIVQLNSDNIMEIGITNEKITNKIIITKNTKIKNMKDATETSLDNIEIGDSVYIEGNIVTSDNDLEKIEASEISFYKKEDLKKEVEVYIRDGYRIDGHSIIDINVDSDGIGYIICDIGLYNYMYPVKLKVNLQTETYLGMGRLLQSNYGYLLHEMCDITLEKKIEDIDNIQGYVKMIEYIAD